MIICNNVKQIGLVLPEAAKFLEENELTKLLDGRYELGNGHYANISTYNPKVRNETAYEAHNNYADIQMVFQGGEIIEVIDRAELEEAIPYNEEIDTATMTSKEGAEVILMPGLWALVMPEDAHRPGIAINPESMAKNRKIVFKMKLNQD